MRVCGAQGGGDRQRRLEAGRMENGKPVAGSQRHQMQQRGGSGATAVVQGSHLYLSGSPYDPMVGDMRVSWTVRACQRPSPPRYTCRERRYLSAACLLVCAHVDR